MADKHFNKGTTGTGGDSSKFGPGIGSDTQNRGTQTRPVPNTFPRSVNHLGNPTPANSSAIATRSMTILDGLTPIPSPGRFNLVDGGVRFDGFFPGMNPRAYSNFGGAEQRPKYCIHGDVFCSVIGNRNRVHFMVPDEVMLGIGIGCCECVGHTTSGDVIPGIGPIGHTTSGEGRNGIGPIGHTTTGGVSTTPLPGAPPAKRH